MIIAKKGVTLVGVNPILLAVGLPCFDQTVALEYGPLAPPWTVITSATGGKHKRASLHLSGNAVDVRSRHYEDWDNQKKGDVAALVSDLLGADFDVLFEDTLKHPDGSFARYEHFHMEWQPK